MSRKTDIIDLVLNLHWRGFSSRHIAETIGVSRRYVREIMISLGLVRRRFSTLAEAQASLEPDMVAAIAQFRKGGEAFAERVESA